MVTLKLVSTYKGVKAKYELLKWTWGVLIFIDGEDYNHELAKIIFFTIEPIFIYFHLK